MATLALTKSPRIVSGGGRITKDVYKGDNSKTWQRGALLKLSGGVITVVVDTSAASAEIDTDDTGTSGARLFFALSDVASPTSGFVAVQEITDDTVIEIPVVATGSTAPKPSNVSKGGSYAGYQIDSGSLDGSNLIGLDVDKTTSPIFNVIDTSNNYNAFNSGSTANYGFVTVKVLSAILA